MSFKISTSFYHFMWQRVLVEFLLYYGFYIFQLSSCSLSNILSFQLDHRQSTKNWFNSCHNEIQILSMTLEHVTWHYSMTFEHVPLLTRTQTYKIPPHIAEENKIVPNLNSRSKNWILGWIPRNFKIFICKLELSFLRENHKNENLRWILWYLQINLIYDFRCFPENGHFRWKFRNKPKIHTIYHFLAFPQKWQFRLENENFEISRNSA